MKFLDMTVHAMSFRVQELFPCMIGVARQRKAGLEIMLRTRVPA
jgi:hypothetical protein